MIIIEIIVLVILCIHMVITTNNRQNRPKTKIQTDRTRILMALMQFTVFLLAILTIPGNYYQIGNIGFSLFINLAGLLLMVVGLGIRIFSMRALGKYYSTILFVEKGQPLMTNGIYGIVRHPIYLGDLILYLSLGLAMGNLLFLVITDMMVIPLFSIRMSVEEKMMKRRYGKAYDEYILKTKRILPFLF
jgi:protein-S-isoprenylcysteine O-methyltransferase Ste14